MPSLQYPPPGSFPKSLSLRSVHLNTKPRGIEFTDCRPNYEIVHNSIPDDSNAHAINKYNLQNELIP